MMSAVRLTSLLCYFAAAQSIGAQATPAGATDDARECVGVAFGPWTPALDWKGAGHDAPLPPKARSRDSASVDASSAPRPQLVDAAIRDDVAGDSTVLLFPAWWPAGVVVRLRREPDSDGSRRGEAMALVADGRLTPPRADVALRRIPCRR